MYDELVKRLREATRFSESRGYSGMANTTEEAADAIEELQEDNSTLNGTVSNLIGQIAELSKPRWIPVEERLPEEEELVLCYTPVDGYMFVGYYFSYKWGSDTVSKWRIITSMRSTKDITKKVTHWRYLPEPPKEEGK